MSKQAKEILELDEDEELIGRGYYNQDEIKGCVNNGIIPYVAIVLKSTRIFCK